MIGKIHFDHEGKRQVAVMLDNGRWMCGVQHVEEVLNTLHKPKQDSPADGEFGFPELHAAAELLNGRLELAPRREAPEGTIH